MKSKESKFQIVYEAEDENIYWLFQREAEMMDKAGVSVCIEPSPSSTDLLLRSRIVAPADFPEDARYIQSREVYYDHLTIARWYPLIKDLTIPTIFCEELNEEASEAIFKEGWEKAFVKNGHKSIVEDSPLDSVWPDVSFESMLKKFSEHAFQGNGFALREYLPMVDFAKERRYWIIGSKIHHSSGNIPNIVKEAANRLKPLGGIFYTIDATPELIVEVNSGETSDRKTDNSAEDFTRWVKEAFAH
jgi:hypothetical protein